MSPDQERRLRQIGAVTIASGPAAPSVARTIVSGWLDDREDRQLGDDVRLLVSELVTNSVRHAAQPAGAPVHIRAAAADGSVRVEVDDPGQGPLFRRGSGGPLGGYGLELVERIATRWGVNRERGTRVWFELAARAPGQQKRRAARLR
jgi:anti-sigma regulatory factor (Ser/Thr protein kinase)